MSSESRVLGYVLDESTAVRVRFVAPEPPLLGDYVLIDYDGEQVLGMVEWVGTRSSILSMLAEARDPAVFENLTRLGAGDCFYEASVRLLGVYPSMEIPRRPPRPGAHVWRAPAGLLREIFGSGGDEWVRIGVLAARPEVEVKVNVNAIVTRHLAVLAVTGAGKSNTVAVLVDRMVRLGGTVVIFDFHGEYIDSGVGGRPSIIEPKLNPRLLSIGEFMALLGIEQRFYNQERLFRKSYNAALEAEGGFIDAILRELKKFEAGRPEDKRAAVAVRNKIDSFLERHGYIVDEGVDDVVARIEPGRANIVDLSLLDEDAADVVVSHFLRRILVERKRYRRTGTGLETPVFIVVEEAHILAPRDRDTLSKYWMARIAREGRKFGVGLCIVSQRPRNIDPDILSQMNNKIVLRIVEPADQRYVREASETLSEDLVKQLPGLNRGEGILIGPMTRIPAVVRIDKYPGPLGGSDIDVVGEWRGRRVEPGIDELLEEVITGAG
ncbi:MAG: ATP-binding protein [Crenarchaeota archaeon]|nr:ATP-binding protein [Thermoproteota archaeon]